MSLEQKEFPKKNTKNERYDIKKDQILGLTKNEVHNHKLAAQLKNKYFLENDQKVKAYNQQNDLESHLQKERQSQPKSNTLKISFVIAVIINFILITFLLYLLMDNQFLDLKKVLLIGIILGVLYFISVVLLISVQCIDHDLENINAQPYKKTKNKIEQFSKNNIKIFTHVTTEVNKQKNKKIRRIKSAKKNQMDYIFPDMLQTPKLSTLKQVKNQQPKDEQKDVQSTLFILNIFGSLSSISTLFLITLCLILLDKRYTNISSIIIIEIIIYILTIAIILLFCKINSKVHQYLQIYDQQGKKQKEIIVFSQENHPDQVIPRKTLNYRTMQNTVHNKIQNQLKSRTKIIKIFQKKQTSILEKCQQKVLRKKTKEKTPKMEKKVKINSARNEQFTYIKEDLQNESYLSKNKIETYKYIDDTLNNNLRAKQRQIKENFQQKLILQLRQKRKIVQIKSILVKQYSRSQKKHQTTFKNNHQHEIQ